MGSKRKTSSRVARQSVTVSPSSKWTSAKRKRSLTNRPASTKTISSTTTTTTTTTNNEIVKKPRRSATRLNKKNTISGPTTRSTSETGTDIAGSDKAIFNREKLKRILECLADQDQQQQQQHPSSKKTKKSIAPEIFNRDRLRKINSGLMKQSPSKNEDNNVDEDNDSDCCVVFSGPSSEKPTPLSTLLDNDKVKNDLNRQTETGAARNMTDTSTTPRRRIERSETNKEKVDAQQPSIVDKDSASVGTNSLKEQMVAKLKAARFRYINQMLYTSSGTDAEQLFKSDPEAYRVYHSGYQNQVSKWPVSPLDVIVKDIRSMPKSKVIADLGCGDAKLSLSVANKVHSFDLVALNDRVVACNMDKVPLKDSSVDIAVFCLSLMGINLADYIVEANRVLKINGLLKIAEVQSRFNDVRKFQQQMDKYGFKFLKKNASHMMFVLLDFKKVGPCDKRGSSVLPKLSLQPCMYKKR